MVQNSQEEGTVSLNNKVLLEVTASLSLLNIYPWVCNLSCWQSTYD